MMLVEDSVIHSVHSLERLARIMLLALEVRIVESNGMALTAGSEVLVGLRVGELAGELNIDELDREESVGSLLGLIFLAAAVDFLHVEVSSVVGDHF